jgi:drug/metabolite transporter (DMT)-like permease
MSFAMIIGAATSRVRGRAGRAARRRVAARTAVSPPDRTLFLLLALYACWGSAIPAMKLMVDTVPPLGGAALVFLVAGLVLAVAARGRPAPTRVQLRRLAVAGVLLLVGGQGLAMVALTEVTASLGAILAATIPLWVVLLGGLIGTPVSVASKVRLAAGFGGIAIVVLTAPNSAIGRAPWAVAAFWVAPILWAAGSLVTAHADRPADRVVATAVQLLAGGTVLLLLALPLGELDPARWSDVSSTSIAAAIFLLVFDSLAGFMLYTRLLASAPAPLVTTYAYVTPARRRRDGRDPARRAALGRRVCRSRPGDRRGRARAARAMRRERSRTCGRASARFTAPAPAPMRGLRIPPGASPTARGGAAVAAPPQPLPFPYEK